MMNSRISNRFVHAISFCILIICFIFILNLSANADSAINAAENAVIVVNGDSVEVHEDAATLVKADDYEISTTNISGVSIYSDTIFNVYNEGENAVSFGVSGIAILDSDMKIGGRTGFFSVKKNTNGIPIATKTAKGRGYNSVIVLDNSDDSFTSISNELADGVGISTGGADSVGKLLEIENTYLWVAGWLRTVIFSNYATRNADAGSTGPNVVVKDSYIECPGNENFMPGFLTMYGSARATLIQGNYAWFYNDIVKTASWGSLAIDGGCVLNVYAVNSYIENSGGGYTIYSPGDGWAELFGVKAISAQYGMFITGNGNGMIGSLKDAIGTDAEKYKTVSSIRKSDYKTRRGETYIEADFAAFLVHLGRESMVSTLFAYNSTLSTENSLTIHDDSTFLNDGNSGATWFWLDTWRGSTLVSRSSNPVMNLDNVNLITRTGTIFQSVVDWEGSGNKPQFSIADGTEAAGIVLNMSNMNVDGDILHNDFYRKMDINLTNTKLAGKIVSGTQASWNARWTADALEYSDAWIAAEDEIASWAGGAPNDLFIYDPNFTLDADAISDLLSYTDEYNDIWGVRMAIDGNSTWMVTGNSSLYSLTIDKGARIKAPKGCKITIYQDCTMASDHIFYDYSTGSIVKDLKPGTTYTGVTIVIEKEKHFGSRDDRH